MDLIAKATGVLVFLAFSSLAKDTQNFATIEGDNSLLVTSFNNDRFGYEATVFDGEKFTVLDVFKGTDSSYPNSFISLNDKIYFTANFVKGGVSRREIFTFDPNDYSITQITEINTASFAFEFSETEPRKSNELFVHDGKLFFVASDNSGATYLWYLDEQDTPIQVSFPESDSTNTQYFDIFSFQQHLIFKTLSSANQTTMWHIDFTQNQQVEKIHSINEMTNANSPYKLQTLFFEQHIIFNFCQTCSGAANEYFAYNLESSQLSNISSQVPAFADLTNINSLVTFEGKLHFTAGYTNESSPNSRFTLTLNQPSLNLQPSNGYLGMISPAVIGDYLFYKATSDFTIHQLAEKSDTLYSIGATPESASGWFGYQPFKIVNNLLFLYGMHNFEGIVPYFYDLNTQSLSSAGISPVDIHSSTDFTVFENNWIYYCQSCYRHYDKDEGLVLGDTVHSNYNVKLFTEFDNAPTSSADSFNVISEESTILDVLNNDTDPNQLSLKLESAFANNGIVTISDNTIEYLSNSQFTGTDTITYIVSNSDNFAVLEQVTVSVAKKVTLEPTPDKPEGEALRKSSGGSISLLMLLSLIYARKSRVSK